MTTPPAEPVLSLQELRNAAAQLERLALAAGGVTEQALDERRPGSAGYPDASPGAWLAYHGWVGMRAGGGERQREREKRPLARVLHEALAETPAAVELRNGTRVHVYAKSLDSLLFLEALDADLQSVLAQMTDLLQATADDDSLDAARDEARAKLLATLTARLALRLYVWILSHEGPGLPFDEHAADPAPPAWTAELHVEDIDALYRAHLQVNRDDLEFISLAFPTDASARRTRLPLSGFLGAMAHEWGLSSREVMRQWSVRGLFAQAITAAQSHRESRTAAGPADGRG